jgi:hypothetical protein
MKMVNRKANEKDTSKHFLGKVLQLFKSYEVAKLSCCCSARLPCNGIMYSVAGGWIKDVIIRQVAEHKGRYA